MAIDRDRQTRSPAGEDSGQGRGRAAAIAWWLRGWDGRARTWEMADASRAVAPCAATGDGRTSAPLADLSWLSRWDCERVREYLKSEWVSKELPKGVVEIREK